MEAAREFGGKLFESVFGNEVRACLRNSLDEVYHREETGLRLKLRLQDVAELADLPWEFLLDSSLDRFFAQSNQTPIIRYVEMPQRIAPLSVKLPLKILVMISSPSDYASLDVKREKTLLQDALSLLSKNGLVQMEWLENATLSALQRHLREGTYHIFHFIGHGGFDRKTEEGVLVLEDEQGHGWWAAAHRIGTLLHDHRTLRLAVLNSCEGARNSRTDPFAGVATSLIRQGIPAVVAMQFEITDKAAVANEQVTRPRAEVMSPKPQKPRSTRRLAPARVTSPQPKVVLSVVSSLKGHTKPVWSVAFSPDGKMLVSGSVDNIVRLWAITIHGRETND